MQIFVKFILPIRILLKYIKLTLLILIKLSNQFFDRIIEFRPVSNQTEATGGFEILKINITCDSY